MNAEVVRAKVYQALKTQGPMPIQALPDRTEATPTEVKGVVLDQLNRDLLRVTPQGNIYIVRPLNAPVPTDIGESLNALTTAPHLVESPDHPLVKYQNPYIDYLPAWVQGQPPSCVGFSVAGLAYLSYLKTTQDFPSPEDTIVRDVRSDGGFTYDRLYRPLPSPWWVFQAARKVGYMVAGSYGARTHDAIEVLQQVGTVPWNYCLTPKTVPAPKFWPKHGSDDETYAYLSKIASAHRVPEMATGQGFDAVCSLIQRYGAASIEHDVFPSVTNMRRDGAIPMPGPTEQSIGKHGCTLYAFDRTLKVVGYIGTWFGFPSRGTIPAEYIDRHAGLAFSIIDDQEPLMPVDEDLPGPGPASDSSRSWLEKIKNLFGGR